MKQFLFLTIALSLGGTAFAEKGQSIMFGEPNPVYMEKPVDTSELLDKIKELLG